MGIFLRNEDHSPHLDKVLTSCNQYDVRLVTNTGTVFTNKLVFFSLLSSWTDLLCDLCSHEEVVIMFPEANRKEVEVAIESLVKSRDGSKMSSLVNGRSDYVNKVEFEANEDP